MEHHEQPPRVTVNVLINLSPWPIGRMGRIQILKPWIIHGWEYGFGPMSNISTISVSTALAKQLAGLARNRGSLVCPFYHLSNSSRSSLVLPVDQSPEHHMVLIVSIMPIAY